MKKILLVLGLFTIIVTSPACKKKKGGDSGGCDEASISFVSTGNKYFQYAFAGCKHYC
jgi:hypothetical protein